MSNILDKVGKNKRVIIYGAGQYADKLYKAIYFTRPDIIVEAFAVSNPSDKETIHLNVPVLNIASINDNHDFDWVVVAMGRKNRDEVAPMVNSAFRDKALYMEKEDAILLQDLFSESLYSIPLDYKTILFDCFHGAGYKDNVKYIAEEIHKRDCDIRIYWYVEDEGESFPEYITPIRYGDLDYYSVLYKAGVIISNNGTDFPEYRKKKGQYLINTWHGIDGIKKVGLDSNNDKNNERLQGYILREFDKIDLMTAGRKFNHYMYRHSLGFKNEIVDWGYPRNDILVKNDTNEREKIRDKIGIKNKELFILYAPTFRQGLGEADIKLVFDIDFLRLKKAFVHRFGCDVKTAAAVHAK